VHLHPSLMLVDKGKSRVIRVVPFSSFPTLRQNFRLGWNNTPPYYISAFNYNGKNVSTGPLVGASTVLKRYSSQIIFTILINLLVQGGCKNSTVCSRWPDWAIFCQLGYFWRLIMIFWKDEVAQNNGDFLSYFLFKEIYYIFTEMSNFKTWFVVGILRFLNWFDVEFSNWA